MSTLRLVGTPWAVILPTAFFPFGVYLAYVFYATSVPRDLLAAGRVDGCSEWQLFRLVCLPLSKTLIGLLTFLSFTANWNNYFLPFVMLHDDRDVYPRRGAAIARHRHLDDLDVGDARERARR